MLFKAFNAQDMFRITKLYTMFEDTFPGGYVFLGEAHDFWECVYVKKGGATICANERVYKLEKGDIIFHKPLEFHKYRIEEGRYAELFIFSFSLEEKNSCFFEDKVFSLNTKQQGIITQFLGFLYEKCGYRSITPDNAPPMKVRKFGTGALHTIFSDEKRDIYIAIILNYIYSLLLSICDSSTTTNEATLAHTDLFKRAVQYMNENIGEKLSIKDISKSCTTSTTSLKNVFIEFSGLGVHKYFLKLKITRAISLLSEGLSVNEIAQMLGFSSQAYFSAAFKRETGYSPTRYSGTSAQKRL